MHSKVQCKITRKTNAQKNTTLLRLAQESGVIVYRVIYKYNLFVYIGEPGK